MKPVSQYHLLSILAIAATLATSVSAQSSSSASSVSSSNSSVSTTSSSSPPPTSSAVSSCGASSSSASSISSSASSVAKSALTCSVGHSTAWHNGYVVTYEVTNTGTEPLTEWEVDLALPDNHTIANLWNGQLGDSSSISNADWNGHLYPGETANFGFQASYQGEFIEPVCRTADDSQPPEIEFDIVVNGLTVMVDVSDTLNQTSAASDVTIEFDGYKTISNLGQAWHTFYSAGDYEITVTASDGENSWTRSELITLTDTDTGNRAPVAKLMLDSSNGAVAIHSDLSFDPDGDELSVDIQREDIGNRAYVTLTVSDGTLSDTVQQSVPFGCETYVHYQAYPFFSYWVDGQTVHADARYSRNVMDLTWEFGDGGTAPAGSDVLVSHTYNEPGQYEISLFGYAGWMNTTHTQVVNIDNGLNNAPGAALQCWRRNRSGESGWHECRALGTFDPDNDPLVLTWEMGDGTIYTTTEISEPISHVYGDTGAYPVTLTVTDGEDTESNTYMVYHISPY